MVVADCGAENVRAEHPRLVTAYLVTIVTAMVFNLVHIVMSPEPGLEPRSFTIHVISLASYLFSGMYRLYLT